MESSRPFVAGALAAIAYVASLAIVAIVSFFAVMVVAVPHAGLLPQWLEVIALGLGWVAVLVLPALVARAVWRRSSKARP